MQIKEVSIRTSDASDFHDIMRIEKQAFGQDEEANLVADLLNDESAKPILSLLAFDEEKPVGHILFTKTTLSDSLIQPKMYLLAPLAVLPDYQGRNIGGKLIQKGLEILLKQGAHYVFVLGHENYYPKYGFIPDAKKHGFLTPFPIPGEHANAWMVLSLNTFDSNLGEAMIVKCADALNEEKYWQE